MHKNAICKVNKISAIISISPVHSVASLLLFLKATDFCRSRASLSLAYIPCFAAYHAPGVSPVSLAASPGAVRAYPIICITLLLCNTYNALCSTQPPTFPAAVGKKHMASGSFPSIFPVSSFQFSSTDTIFLAIFSSNFRKLFF